MARADVSLRRFDDALKEFERARTIDARAVEEPQALHDLAIAQRYARKLVESMATYRALVPRLGLLPVVQDRALVLLEAACVAMAQGDDGMRDAISLLTEARAHPASRLDPDVLALLALVLDRSGSTAQAAEVVELMRARGLELALPDPDSTAYSYLVLADDALAMFAISLERTDPKRAAESWERYIAKEGAARWREHAKRHLDASRAAAARKLRGPVAVQAAPGAKR
jgi:tetratricopeptide (TPR) repeat protein